MHQLNDYFVVSNQTNGGDADVYFLYINYFYIFIHYYFSRTDVDVRFPDVKIV
jgi:hypothetical protein